MADAISEREALAKRGSIWFVNAASVSQEGWLDGCQFQRAVCCRRCVVASRALDSGVLEAIRPFFAISNIFSRDTSTAQAAQCVPPLATSFPHPRQMFCG
jgi:hypothetical protein